MSTLKDIIDQTCYNKFVYDKRTRSVTPIIT